MTKIKTISILGCGWFGLPLAKELVNAGYFVRGATTSNDKMKVLELEGIDPYLVHFNPRLISDRGEDFFNSDTVCVNIPPGNNRAIYLEQISEIIKLVVKHQIKHVLFISSTSVYADCCGEVFEETEDFSNTESGRTLRSAENLFLNEPSVHATVIRFGGLIGPGRHPGRFFAGKKDIANGKAPVNLIHLEDCIGIVRAVLDEGFVGQIINACAPDHPSRQEFYTLAAKVSRLPLPVFNDELCEWKIVSSKKAETKFKYQYKVGDLLSWLNNSLP